MMEDGGGQAVVEHEGASFAVDVSPLYDAASQSFRRCAVEGQQLESRPLCIDRGLEGAQARTLTVALLPGRGAAPQSDLLWQLLDAVVSLEASGYSAWTVLDLAGLSFSGALRPQPPIRLRNRRLVLRNGTIELSPNVTISWSSRDSGQLLLVLESVELRRNDSLLSGPRLAEEGPRPAEEGPPPVQLEEPQLRPAEEQPQGLPPDLLQLSGAGSCLWLLDSQVSAIAAEASSRRVNGRGRAAVQASEEARVHVDCSSVRHQRGSGVHLSSGASLLARRSDMLDNGFNAMLVQGRGSAAELRQARLSCRSGTTLEVLEGGLVGMSDCEVRAGFGMRWGVEVRNSSALQLQGCSVTGNGVVVHPNSSLVLLDSTVHKAPRHGIAVGPGSSLQARDSRVEHMGGPGILGEGASMHLANCTVQLNDRDGVLLDGGKLLLERSRVAGNRGDGIHVVGTQPANLTLQQCSVQHNLANGIRIAALAANVTVVGGAIEDNALRGIHHVSGTSRVNVSSTTVVQRNGPSRSIDADRPAGEPAERCHTFMGLASFEPSYTLLQAQTFEISGMRHERQPRSWTAEVRQCRGGCAESGDLPGSCTIVTTRHIPKRSETTAPLPDSLWPVQRPPPLEDTPEGGTCNFWQVPGSYRGLTRNQTRFLPWAATTLCQPPRSQLGLYFAQADALYVEKAIGDTSGVACRLLDDANLAGTVHREMPMGMSLEHCAHVCQSEATCSHVNFAIYLEDGADGSERRAVCTIFSGLTIDHPNTGLVDTRVDDRFFFSCAKQRFVDVSTGEELHVNQTAITEQLLANVVDPFSISGGFGTAPGNESGTVAEDGAAVGMDGGGGGGGSGSAVLIAVVVVAAVALALAAFSGWAWTQRRKRRGDRLDEEGKLVGAAATQGQGVSARQGGSAAGKGRPQVQPIGLLRLLSAIEGHRLPPGLAVRHERSPAGDTVQRSRSLVSLAALRASALERESPQAAACGEAGRPRTASCLSVDVPNSVRSLLEEQCASQMLSRDAGMQSLFMLYQLSCQLNTIEHATQRTVSIQDSDFDSHLSDGWKPPSRLSMLQNPSYPEDTLMDQLSRQNADAELSDKHLSASGSSNLATLALSEIVTDSSLSEAHANHREPSSGSTVVVVAPEEGPGGGGSAVGELPRKLKIMMRLMPVMPDVDLAVDPQHDFKYVRKLGRGAFATVWEAWWTGRDGRWKHVALKVIDLDSLAVNSRTSRVVNLRAVKTEMEIMTRINHPSIVRCYGGCVCRDMACLVLEFMEGGELGRYLNRSRKGVALDVAEVLSVGTHIASGLSFLHPLIIHGDLKPQNILLDAEGNLKLTDFGLSKIKIATIMSSKLGGTPAYAAPEVFGNEAVTEKCDIYSLAVVMWECLSGEPPWKDMHYPMQIMYEVHLKNNRPPLPSSTPEPLAQIIERCWHADPARRLAASELALQLRIVLAGLEAPQGHTTSSAVHAGQGEPFPRTA